MRFCMRKTLAALALLAGTSALANIGEVTQRTTVATAPSVSMPPPRATQFDFSAHSPRSSVMVVPPGEWISLPGGGRLRFEGIDDSRCPRDAACFWAGNISVGFLLQAGGVDQVGTLTWPADQLTTGQNSTACVLSYRLTLTGVEPERSDSEPIDLARYRFTLGVGQC